MKLTSLISESSLSRIWKHVSEHESGTISAWRYAKDCGEGEPYTKAEKQQRNAQLKSKLLAMKYGVTSIKGTYIENFGTDAAKEVDEESFIVVDLNDSGNLRKELIRLGTFYDQDSITFSKPNGEYYLISSNTCPKGYPGNGSVGKSVKLGKAFFGEKGEIHSKINGRPFVMKEAKGEVSKLTDYPPTEIRTHLMTAEQVKLKD